MFLTCFAQIHLTQHQKTANNKGNNTNTRERGGGLLGNMKYRWQLSLRQLREEEPIYNSEIGVVSVAGVECVAGERGALEANFEALNMFDILML